MKASEHVILTTPSGATLEIKSKAKKERDLSHFQKKSEPIYLRKPTHPQLEESKPNVLYQVSTNQIWVGTDTGLLITYSAKTGSRLKIMKGHNEKIYSIQRVFDHIWSCAADGRIKVWRAEEEGESVKLVHTINSECVVVRSLLLVEHCDWEKKRNEFRVWSCSSNERNSVIEVWNPATFEREKRIDMGGDFVREMSFYNKTNMDPFSMSLKIRTTPPKASPPNLQPNSVWVVANSFNYVYNPQVPPSLLPSSHFIDSLTSSSFSFFSSHHFKKRVLRCTSGRLTRRQ